MSLCLSDVTLLLHGKPLVRGLSVEVPDGDVVTLMGPSGSGKSSLLALLTGNLPPAFTASGSVRLDGAEVLRLPPERRGIGILFQDDLLFPHLTVGENLSFAIPKSRARGTERRRLVEHALEEAELGGFAARDPATLSGGQRARVSLLRALLAEPKALLLDEPFGKLDAALRDRFRSWVFGRVRQSGVPTLLVTHDPADAEAAGGPVVRLGEL